MVMPRAFSSGALSIWSYARNVAPPCFASTLVIAAVRVVFPWSTWPMVPTFTWGLVRSNFSLLIVAPLSFPLGLPSLGHDLVGYLLRHLCVMRELHRVRRPTLRPGAKVGGV